MTTDGTTSAAGTLERLIARQQALADFEVIAPVVEGRIRVAAGRSMVSRLAVGGVQGWGVFRVHEWRAEWLREADPWEREAMLERLPARHMRLAYAEGQTWWAQEVAPRGSASLVSVHVVEDAAQFDVIVARNDGEHWLCGGVAARVPGTQAVALRQALQARRGVDELPLAWMTERDRRLYKAVRDIAEFIGRSKEERRVQCALLLGGAELVSFSPQGSRFVVVWRKHQQTIRTVVDQDLHVLSAGFCLSGQDRRQDLTSLASLLPAGRYLSQYPADTGEEIPRYVQEAHHVNAYGEAI